MTSVHRRANTRRARSRASGGSAAPSSSCVDHRKARSPASTAALTPNQSSSPASPSRRCASARRRWAVGCPRRSGERSMTSSCSRAKVCSSSRAAAAAITPSSCVGAGGPMPPVREGGPQPLSAGGDEALHLGRHDEAAEDRGRATSACRRRGRRRWSGRPRADRHDGIVLGGDVGPCRAPWRRHEPQCRRAVEPPVGGRAPACASSQASGDDASAAEPVDLLDRPRAQAGGRHVARRRRSSHVTHSTPSTSSGSGTGLAVDLGDHHRAQLVLDRAVVHDGAVGEVGHGDGHAARAPVRARPAGGARRPGAASRRARMAAAGVRPGRGPRPLARGPAGQQHPPVGRHHVAREAEVERRAARRGRGPWTRCRTVGRPRRAGRPVRRPGRAERGRPRGPERWGEGRDRSRRPGRPWRGAASLGGRAWRTDVRSPLLGRGLAVRTHPLAHPRRRVPSADPAGRSLRPPGRRRRARTGGRCRAAAPRHRRTSGSPPRARARPRGRGPGCGC